MFKVYNDWTKEKILYLTKAQCNCLTPTSNVISAAICIANICRNNIRKDDICLQGDVNNLLFIFVVNYYAVISRQRKQNTWICNMAHINDQVIIRPRYLPMLITFDFPFFPLWSVNIHWYCRVRTGSVSATTVRTSGLPTIIL